MLKKSLLSTVLCLTVASVFAGSHGEAEESSSAFSHINFHNFYTYLGVGAGSKEGMPAGSEFANSDLTRDNAATSSLSENNGVVRLALGYLPRVNNKVRTGFETGVTYFGQAKYSADTLSQSLEMNYYGVDLLAVAAISISDNILLGAKFGVVREFVDTKTENLSIDVDGNDSYLFEAGVSLAYKVGHRTGISLSYLHTFGNDPGLVNSGDIDNAPSIDVGLISVVRRF